MLHDNYMYPRTNRIFVKVGPLRELYEIISTNFVERFFYHTSPNIKRQSTYSLATEN